MGTDIQSFDPQKIQESIRKKIQATFVDMIPDEAWNKMIEKEIKDFMEPGPEQYRYGHNQERRPSNFSALVQDELTIETKKRLHVIFSSTEWTGRWEDNREEASKKAVELIAAAAPKIMEACLAEMVQNVIRQMRHN